MGQWRYRRVPVCRYDVRRMESWLEDLSEQGLELAGIAAMVGIFRETEPVRRRCRLVPAAVFPPEKREDRLRLYEQCGWDLTADIEGVFYVFRASVPEPTEVPVNLDPAEERAQRKEIRSRQIVFGVCAGLLLVIHFAVLTPYLFRGYRFFEGLIRGPVIGWGMVTLIAVLLAAVLFQNTFYLGNISEKALGWRMRARLGMAGTVIWVLLLLGGAALTQFGTSHRGTRNYADVGADLPVPALSEIEGETFTYTGRVMESGTAIDNSVYYTWSLLAPEQYRVLQTGQTDGCEVRLRTEYYRTAGSWLAKGFFRELQEEAAGEGKCRMPDADGFEEAVLIETGEGTTLILRRGRGVLRCEYTGQLPAADFAEAVAAGLAGRCGK